ncbi:MAG: cell surface protein SprA, partial [Calditrichaeota bacterium]
MIFRFLNLSGSARIHSTNIAWFFFCVSLLPALAMASPQETNHADYSLGLRVHLSLDPRASLFTDTYWPGLSMAGYPGGYNYRPPRSYLHSVRMDTTGKYIVASETFLGQHLRLPQYIPFSLFKQLNTRHTEERLWHAAAERSIFEKFSTGQHGPGGVNIDIPVPIKSQTFQKIFGGNSVGLNVQGDIRIEGGFRNEKRSEVRTTIAQGSNTNFKMNQTQRFTVTGRIGEKVTVNVDQDSERAFDFNNNIKLNYKGFEDEVVQSIEAGNISLSLPATRFVTFSGKSTGLFGVKMNMQLGDLHVTTIASQEKGQSQRLKVGGGATEGVQKLKDYDYKRFTYFFLDDFFRRQYRNYSEKWVHIYEPRRAIKRIEVYKSQAGYEYDPNSIRGWALLDPSNVQDTLNVSDKEVYFGHFIRMEPEKDYYVETSLGYIIMNQPLSKDEVLAVAYEDSSGNIFGDIDFNAQTDSTIILKLIKAQSPTPSFKSWNLEWKNVYSLGGRNIEVDEESFKVKIYYQPPSGSDEESQGTNSYLNIFGLDVRDKSGNLGSPDNAIDIDDNIINRARGELIFPNLRPFDPDTVFIDKNGNGIIEPNEFEVSLLQPSRREPAIYDTTSQSFITQNSRFYIEVKSKNRSANYSLGFNVIEGSEKVILNGRELKRGQDYTVDYWSGTLTLLNEQATDPNAQLDITYERNQLFQLEKKTILGTRAEYRFGANNFLGGTLLYLNERTLD